MGSCEREEDEGKEEGEVDGGGQEVGASTLQSEKKFRFYIGTKFMCCVVINVTLLIAVVSS